MPLHAEEAVVEKRVVPTEETGRAQARGGGEPGVDATLRRETAEVDREVPPTRTCATAAWTTTAWAGRSLRSGRRFTPPAWMTNGHSASRGVPVLAGGQILQAHSHTAV